MAGDEKGQVKEILESGEYQLSTGPNGDSIILLVRDFLSPTEADDIYKHCLEEMPFELYKNTREDTGETLVEPRKIAWYGDYTYTYDTITHPAKKEWTETLINIRQRLEKKIDYKLNSVLGNLYRDKSDMVPWHSDNEPEFGVNPSIASISLGEERRFGLRKVPPEGPLGDYSNMPLYWVPLPHGSLVVMKGAMQFDWQHCIPKEERECQPRINLTYRWLIPPDERPMQTKEH
ncbi:alpha-ketoglutarate-dependent dioxygenase alkB homolog 3-like [Amphiura filiformis]|uniref:alpha-ketoglutarate-dependent dioxygenase alkB homolog 3-like n=1 Tax=Amphiura filiformis TaxID=82378 RepID=UPI003B224533